MADVTIHDVDSEWLNRLAARAEANGRSIEEEIRAIIEERVPRVRNIEGLRRLAHESHERLRGRIFSDSTELIRKDRER